MLMKNKYFTDKNWYFSTIFCLMQCQALKQFLNLAKWPFLIIKQRMEYYVKIFKSDGCLMWQ